MKSFLSRLARGSAATPAGSFTKPTIGNLARCTHLIFNQASAPTGTVPRHSLRRCLPLHCAELLGHRRAVDRKILAVENRRLQPGLVEQHLEHALALALRTGARMSPLGQTRYSPITRT